MRKSIVLFALCTLGMAACKKEKPQNYVVTGTNNNTVKTYNITVNSWTQSSQQFWYYDYMGITDGTNMDGGVMVYLQTGPYEYTAMPYTGADKETYFSIMAHSYVELRIRSASGNTSIANPGNNWVFRIVVIPPARYNPHVNHADYKQVKQYYNLAD